MSEWITDRKPMSSAEVYVYGHDGLIRYWSEIKEGEPWKPIPKCEPYVKPKRFIVRKSSTGDYDVYFGNDMCCAIQLPTREAAERIASIYEEVMP